MHIVFLPAWYPNRNDDMDGLFVRKHALAVAAHHQVDVLFLKAEPNLKEPHFENFEHGNLREHYIYYSRAANKALRIFRFLAMFRSGFRHICQKYGKPDLVHAHVLDGNSFMALWTKYRYHIPYVVTEHWSRYLHGDSGKGLRAILTRLTARKSRCLMPVSQSLKNAMQSCGLSGHYKVVPNVVDDFFFQDITPPAISQTKTILHICCFDEASKNNYGLLRTVKKLSETRSDFKLLMVGDGKDRAATQKYAEQLQLPQDAVIFVGKLQPPEIKKALNACSFSVLFSNYETQSVVICESLACGKPVVATHVGGIPELINETNGITVPVQDETALYHALNRMLDTYQTYNSADISHRAEEFSFASVGEKYSRIYQSAVSKSK